MKPIINRFLMFAFAAGAAAVAGAQDLQGPWTLRVENMEHREISSSTIRFTDKAAPSCMAGNWKRVIVEQSKTTDKSFFPMSEPLSYQIVGSEVTIGRNEVCDGYLHLRGKLDAEGAQGTYSGFSISGGDQLGHFSLTPQNSRSVFKSFEATAPDAPELTFLFSEAYATSESPVVISIVGRKLTAADRVHRVELQKHWLSVNVPKNVKVQMRSLVKCKLKRKGEYSFCDLYEVGNPETKEIADYYIYVGNWPLGNDKR